MSLAGSVSDAENKSKAWALRCTLEMQLHHKAVFTTLTYSNEHLRQRSTENTSADSLNDYAIDSRSEPGELFGSSVAENTAHARRDPTITPPFRVAEHEGKTVQAAWDFGHTVTEKITPERIAYCAGYTAKKYGDENRYETWRMPDGIGRRKSPVGSTAKPVNTWYANPTRKGHGNQKSPGIGSSPSCR